MCLYSTMGLQIVLKSKSWVLAVTTRRRHGYVLHNAGEEA